MMVGKEYNTYDRSSLSPDVPPTKNLYPGHRSARDDHKPVPRPDNLVVHPEIADTPMDIIKLQDEIREKRMQLKELGGAFEEPWLDDN